MPMKNLPRSRDCPTRVRRIGLAAAWRNLDFWISRQLRGEEIHIIRCGGAVIVLPGPGAPIPDHLNGAARLRELRHCEIVHPRRRLAA